MSRVQLDTSQHLARRARDHVATTPSGPELANRAVALLDRWQRQVRRPVVLVTGSATLNFHPDRPVRGGGSVLEAVAASGLLRNQYETSTTNGFAWWEKGAVRVRREGVLFGGAYDAATAASRPKYAALNLFGTPRGGWPRYGSCHWVLRDDVLERSTCTVPGSHAARSWWGTYEQLTTLLASVPPLGAPAAPHRYPRIDGTVELQVHGDLSLGDVAALVLDPSFRGTPTERVAEHVAATYGFPVRWAPPLSSTGTEWAYAGSHQRAAGLVEAARAAGVPVTAAWIGLDAASHPEDALRLGSAVDVTGRYLWNRLLLTAQPSGCW